MEILFEDANLLIVNKPAGLATMGVPVGTPSLLSWLGKRAPAARLGVITRLDAPVTGCVLIAKSSAIASQLNRQNREGKLQKDYLALVGGRVKPACGVQRDALLLHPRHRRVTIVSRGTPEARDVALWYQVRRHIPADQTLLRIELETGRKHQIRAQLSAMGHPIVGDRKYGSGLSLPAGIALHARRLCLVHPVTKATIRAVARVPSAWHNAVAARQRAPV